MADVAKRVLRAGRRVDGRPDTAWGRVAPRAASRRAAPRWAVLRRVAACLVASLLTVAPALLPDRASAQALSRPDGVLGPLHPVYNTSYDVLRARKTWNQSFKLDHRLDSLLVSTSITSKIERNEDLSDLETRVSRSRSTLDYTLFGGLRTGVLLDFDRNRRTQTTSNREATTNTYQLTAGVTRRVAGLRVAANGRAGYTEQDASTFTTGFRTVRDDTRQTGPEINLDLSVTSGAGATRRPLIYGLDASSTTFRQTTDNTKLESQSDGTETRTDTFQKSDNVTRSVSANATWRGLSWVESTVRVSRSTADLVRPNATLGSIEKFETRDDNVTVDLELKPVDDLAISTAYSIADSRSRSGQEVQNRDQSQDSFILQAAYPLLGWDTSVDFTSRSDVREYFGVEGGSTTSLEDVTTDFVSLKGTLRRRLSDRITLTYSGELSLTQDFYEKGLLDKDKQNRVNDVNFSYEPFDAFSSSVRLTEARTRTVNVHPDRSANTNTEQQVSVEATYSYDARRFTATQKITVTAKSREFDFDDAAQSDLTRNSRLNTTVAVPIYGRARVTLDHRYNFRNSGQYTDEDADGIRLFALEREVTEQELTLATAYAPIRDLTVSGEQRLRVNLTESPDSPPRRSTRYDLELKTTFKRRLMKSIDTNLDVTRIISTQEDYYWKVRASVNHVF